MHHLSVRALLIYMLLSSMTALLIGCDSQEPCTETTSECRESSGSDIVEGVDMNRLFAPPTSDERNHIRNDWAARGRNTQQYRWTPIDTTAAPDGAELVVYRGTAGSPDSTLYGVVRRPLRSPGDARSRPLVLLLPDTTPQGEVITNSFLVSELPIASFYHDEYVYATLLYRGSTVDVGDMTFSSTLAPRPADYDVDDALSFFDAAEQERFADPSRRSMMGLGYGGNVMLLALARAPDLDANIAVSLAAPTNLFLQSFRLTVRELLQERGVHRFPSIEALDDHVITPLRNGDLSISEARLELLRRSPSEFLVEASPFLYVGHGTLDFRVPIEHSRSLPIAAGNPNAVYQSFEETHETLLTNTKITTTVSQLMNQYLIKGDQ